MGWGKLADLADEYGINSDEVEEYLEKLRDKGSDIQDVWDEMDDDEKESQVDAIYDRCDLDNPDRWGTPSQD